MSSTTDPIAPSFLGAALRRNVALISIVTVAFAALGYFLAASQPASYESKVRVLLQPSPGNPYSPDSGTSGPQITIAMTTESQVVDSTAVSDLTAKKIGSKFVPGSGTVSASVPPNTQLLLITYDAPNAAAARDGAQAVAGAFLDYRRERSASTQKTKIDILTKQAATVKASLDAASKRAAVTAPPPEATQQVQLYANELATLQNNISTLQSAGSDPGQVVSAATLAVKPSGVDPKLVALAGALVGLVLGLLLALLRQRTDKRVFGALTARVAGVPVLAASSRRRRFGGQGTSESTDSLNHLLRTSVLAALPAPSAFAISPISSRLNASVLSLEVAQLVAQAGYRVVVIDATSDGALTRLTGLDGQTGLAQALTQGSLAPIAMHPVGNVDVVPTGGEFANSESLLAGSRFGRLVEEAQTNADYVVVVTGVASTPTAMGVARVVGHLILLGEDGRTTTVAVEEAALRARQARAGILGMAMMPRMSRRAPKSVIPASAAPPVATPPAATRPVATPAGLAPSSVVEPDPSAGGERSVTNAAP